MEASFTSLWEHYPPDMGGSEHIQLHIAPQKLGASILNYSVYVKCLNIQSC